MEVHEKNQKSVIKNKTVRFSLRVAQSFKKYPYQVICYNLRKGENSKPFAEQTFASYFKTREKTGREGKGNTRIHTREAQRKREGRRLRSFTKKTEGEKKRGS